jgi:tripeptide aminopeptidase
MPNLTRLEQTFLDLVAIDEVYPHESEVLQYIKRRLAKAGSTYKQDQAGNIVARVAGGAGEPLAIVGHTDIAAPLVGRQVIVDADVIKTDGASLLGGDDKTAVAVMLELADHAQAAAPARPVELIFTIGEESGCVGAIQLDMSLVRAKQALVLDWMGRINHVVTRSPAYVKIDVEYVGRTAHPAEWRKGKNAGAALIEAAHRLPIGEYAPGVTCNIGVFGFGKARNQVPGTASLQAELRSFDTSIVESAAAEIEQLFREVAHERDLQPKVDITKDSPAYALDQSGATFAAVTTALKTLQLQPVLEPTYGCFDGNMLSARGLDVVMLGAAYYAPHSPGEYVDRAELAEFFEFIKQFVTP